MWSGWWRHSAMGVAVLLLAGALVPLSAGYTAAGASLPAEASHAPIRIVGNAGFTAANGVISGNGTLASPYVIQGWSINASTASGVEVANTTAYFELVDVVVCCGGSSYNAYQLTNVTHGRVVNSTAASSLVGMVLSDDLNVTVLGGNVSSVYQNIEIFHSRDVNVSQVDISGGYSGVDASWVTGLELWHDNVTHIYGASTGIFIGDSSNVRLGASYDNASGPAVMIIRGTDILLTGSTFVSMQAAGLELGPVNDTSVVNNVIQGSGWPYSTVYLSGENATLDRNRILGGDPAGVAIWAPSDNITLVRNTVRNSTGYALDLEGTRRATVHGNDFSGNARGIFLSTRGTADIRANAFSRNGIFISGPSLEYFVNHTITPDNVVDGRPIVYTTDCGTATIDGAVAGQILLANCTSARVANETIDGTGVGIEAAYVGGLAISNVTVTNATDYGLYLQGGGSASVANSTFRHDRYGVWIQDSAHTRIADSVADDQEEGLDLAGGTADLVHDAFAGNVYAAVLSDVTSGSVVDSKFDLTATTGLRLIQSTDFTIRRNLFQDNGYGIEVFSSARLQFDHNSFIRNAYQAVDNTGPGVNKWDSGYPYGGNYWSDYKGWDDCQGPNQDICTSGDGLGDSPYTVWDGSVDHYPLVPVNPPNQLPVAVIFASQPIYTGQTVEFSGTSSYDPDGYPLIASEWAIDGVGVVAGSYLVTSFPAPGNYTVSLTVTDVRHGTNTTSLVVTVTHAPLTATFSWAPANPKVGQPIAFNATGSGGLPPYSFSWVFGDGSNGSGMNVSHTYSHRGVFSVSLFVVDGTSVTTLKIQDVVVSPGITAAFTVQPLMPRVNNQVVLDGSQSRDVEGSIASYKWNVTGSPRSSYEGSVVSVRFVSAGVHAVTLTVTDAGGATDSATQFVLVYAPEWFVTVSHSSGFRIPVPSAWDTHTDYRVQDQILPVVSLGPVVNDFRTNLIVTYMDDSTARETHAYLSSAEEAIFQGVTQDSPDAYLSGGVMYVTVSGHAAVGFTIAYSTHAYVQRFVVVVSAAHNRDWMMLLTVDAGAYNETNATFRAIVSGFEITALTSAAVMLILVAVVGATTIAAAVVIVIHRKKRTFQARNRPVSFLAMPYAFCVECGASMDQGESHCSRCGHPAWSGPPPTAMPPERRVP